MTSNSKTVLEVKTYNILLLGETGVGKSTFINAFANYISFESLTDAIEADKLTSLIPTKFTILDENFEAKDIIFGSDENEVSQPGASATQSARAYRFKVGNSVIRLIDTPGMGDTRGIRKDEENFERLLDVIGELKEIHIVCLLLKPNDSRITVLFEYCVKKLFSYLQRSFCDNIVFLFTNSRGTLYRPGDTIVPLKEILKDIATMPPKVNIPFNTKNVFCIDNEAFRFLIAKTQGIQFTEDEIKRYSTSWTKSSDTCLALVKYATQIKPHKIQETISINEARRLVSILYEPLGNVIENIVKNVKVIRQYKEKLEGYQNNMINMEEELYTPVINFTINSEKPSTVCTHTTCTKIIQLGNIKKIKYRVCHVPCYYRRQPETLIGDPIFKTCTEMLGGICKICDHSYMKHMYQKQTAEMTENKIINENIDLDKQKMQNQTERLKEKLNELEYRKDIYRQEIDIIQTAMAKFTHFLKHNAIVNYMDKYKNYIKFLIDREKNLGDAADQDLINYLKNLLSVYKEKKKQLKNDLKNAKRLNADVVSVVTAGQIVDIVQELYALKLSGSNIQDIYNKVRVSREREILSSTEMEFIPSKEASIKFIRAFQ